MAAVRRSYWGIYSKDMDYCGLLLAVVGYGGSFKSIRAPTQMYISLWALINAPPSHVHNEFDWAPKFPKQILLGPKTFHNQFD